MTKIHDKDSFTVPHLLGHSDLRDVGIHCTGSLAYSNKTAVLGGCGPVLTRGQACMKCGYLKVNGTVIMHRKC